MNNHSPLRSTEYPCDSVIHAEKSVDLIIPVLAVNREVRDIVHGRRISQLAGIPGGGMPAVRRSPHQGSSECP